MNDEAEIREFIRQTGLDRDDVPPFDLRKRPKLLPWLFWMAFATIIINQILFGVFLVAELFWK